jgi:hypothetical protein
MQRMSLHKCRKSPSRVHFAPVIIADDAPAAAALVRCSHFSLSLAFYFLGRTHSILVEHNEVQIVSHRRAQSAIFLSPARTQILVLHEMENVI